MLIRLEGFFWGFFGFFGGVVHARRELVVGVGDVSEILINFFANTSS